MTKVFLVLLIVMTMGPAIAGNAGVADPSPMYVTNPDNPVIIVDANGVPINMVRAVVCCLYGTHPDREQNKCVEDKH